MKFTKLALDALTMKKDVKENARESLYFDDETPGLGIRVTRRGQRTFIFQFWNGAKVRRVTIGDYGDFTLHEARERARELRYEMRGGADPVQAKRDRAAAEARQAERDAVTLDILFERWDSLALKDRRPRYRAEALRALRKAFHDDLKKPAGRLTGARIQAVLDALSVRTPTHARRVRAYARAAVGWATKRKLLDANPCATVVVEGREVSRDRVLTDAEIGEAWRGAEQLGGAVGAFLKLAMLTLQRRNEVAGMRWEELTPDLAVWIVPAERAKNGRAHDVHLAPAARAVLEGLRKDRIGACVFGTVPRDRKNRREDYEPIMSGFSDVMDRLRGKIIEERKAAGLAGDALQSPDWRMHDLRRSGVTVLARQGVPPHVADRLLNHLSGTLSGVAAVYQRNEFMPERKAALEQWAAHVLRAATPPKSSKRQRAAPRRRSPAKISSSGAPAHETSVATTQPAAL